MARSSIGLCLTSSTSRATSWPHFVRLKTLIYLLQEVNLIRNSRWPLQPVLMNRIWITSWQGKEELRARIQAVVREVYADDLTVREKYPSSVATGLICGAMRDPSSSSRRPLLRMLSSNCITSVS